jgi:hypothetical protein
MMQFLTKLAETQVEIFKNENRNQWKLKFFLTLPAAQCNCGLLSGDKLHSLSMAA